ncbi:ribosomal large subunit pseudouridine synthase D [Microbacteriaceae bacterium MWH-Ta3]|nr:ribosomal large subunit pseudouridine synthase D [Microbacteriaceae bacterium MWH-Ta3]
MSHHRVIPVPDGVVGERVDSALSKVMGFSRTFAAEIVDAGGVEIDGRRVGKSDRVSANSLLSVTWSDKKEPTVVSAVIPEMAIVYDDDHIVIVDKPPFLAAHPSLGWEGDTVVGALVGAGYRISTSGPPERQGIVHRLDVGTSGLMIVAKSEIAYSVMKDKFRNREVSKEYHALVQGHPDPSSGTIDAPLGRHPGSAWKFAVISDGRHAVTHYETIEAYTAASLLRIDLETGRTHQIRVHMSAHRHPLVGDTLYGADPTLGARLGLTRQWLHAVRLVFDHPVTGEVVEVSAPYPADLQGALDILDAH